VHPERCTGGTFKQTAYKEILIAGIFFPPVTKDRDHAGAGGSRSGLQLPGSGQGHSGILADPRSQKMGPVTIRTYKNAIHARLARRPTNAAGAARIQMGTRNSLTRQPIAMGGTPALGKVDFFTETIESG
jgi:hypothetical protein